MDSKTGKQQILAVGSSNIPFDRVILRIQGTSVTQLSSSPIEYELNGVWFVPNQHYYVAGDGIFEKNLLNETSWKNNPLDITTYAITTAAGNDVNDIFFVGAFGECLHWNGASWFSYRDQVGIGSGGYSTIAINRNVVAIGGYDSQEAVLRIGTR